jgi:hypothetical protein
LGAGQSEADLRYRRSPLGRKSHTEAVKRWQKANQEKCKAYKRLYRERRRAEARAS